MARLRITQDGRTRFDGADNVVRSFFGTDLVEPLEDHGQFVALDDDSRAGGPQRTDEFLETNRAHFRLDDVQLSPGVELRASASRSVRYDQLHEGLPVYGGHLVVAIRDRDHRIMSTVNRLDYRFPPRLANDAPLDAREAIEAIRNKLRPIVADFKTIGQPERFVYRHRKTESQQLPDNPPRRAEILALERGEKARAYVVWRVRLKTRDPIGHWEILVDTKSGALVKVVDRRRYDQAPGRVFHPDPITSSQDPSLSWNTPAARLDAECVNVTLDNLDTPPAGADYKLEGRRVRIVEREDPPSPPPESRDFSYGSKDPYFQDVMSYYYLDRLITSLRGLGVVAFNELSETPIDVDPHCSYSSFSDDEPPYIALDGGGGVPDGTDPSVAVHEYGHVIHHYLVRLYSFSSYEEGFCDFLAACWLDRFNPHRVDPAKVFPWDENSTEVPVTTRRVDLAQQFSDPGYSGYGTYLQGGVYASGLWDFYQNIGGNSAGANVRVHAANEAIATYLEMLVLIQDGGTAPTIPTDLVLGMIEADAARTGGLYKKVIWDAFRRRDLWSELTPLGDIDVWIHDNPGDPGEHAGPRVYWKSQDIWTRRDPPEADPNPDAAHQVPIVGITNYLYVRVHNRGTLPAGANTLQVTAYHCIPGTGMIWPDDFVSISTLAVTDEIPPGGSVRVGPFPWTPNVPDHECLLAVVDGDEDVSISRELRPVGHGKFVRFDNNVGQRNVSPQLVVSGGSAIYAFMMRGGREASKNRIRINTRALPAEATVDLCLPRRLAERARLSAGVSVEENKSRSIVLRTSGRNEATIEGIPMLERDRAGVTIQFNLPERIDLEREYPIEFSHEQNEESAGGMTFVLLAVGEDDGLWFGNRKSKELHVARCSSLSAMSQRNKVPFSSIQEAITLGYRCCTRCLSDDETVEQVRIARIRIEDRVETDDS